MSSCAANVINMPLTLDIQGNLRLCNHSPVVVGNIYTDSLDVLFNSNYAQEWKEIIPKECSGCSDYPKCLGGCRAASEQIGLKLSNADPIIKQYSQENK
jgi:radical SAM protein with 4Fe4S-binding SPASM domain